MSFAVNLRNGVTEKFSHPIDFKKVKEFINENRDIISGFVLYSSGQMLAIPIPKKFRVVQFSIDERKNFGTKGGFSVIISADDVLLKVTKVFESEMAKIELIKTGNPRYFDK